MGAVEDDFKMQQMLQDPACAVLHREEPRAEFSCLTENPRLTGESMEAEVRLSLRLVLRRVFVYVGQRHCPRCSSHDRQEIEWGDYVSNAQDPDCTGSLARGLKGLGAVYDGFRVHSGTPSFPGCEA